jgi:hypothetical protein
MVRVPAMVTHIALPGADGSVRLSAGTTATPKRDRHDDDAADPVPAVDPVEAGPACPSPTAVADAPGSSGIVATADPEDRASLTYITVTCQTCDEGIDCELHVVQDDVDGVPTLTATIDTMDLEHHTLSHDEARRPLT